MTVTDTTRTTTLSTLVPSPIGDLLLTSDGDHLTGLFMSPHKGRPDARDTTDGRAPRVLDDTAAQLRSYFAGELETFDVPTKPTGTPFQLRVWAALCEIPYGETISYAELAHSVESPSGYRAVGQANGRNPISIIIPCHRVIGADGRLAGYGGGTDRKRFLLDLECPGRLLL